MKEEVNKTMANKVVYEKIPVDQLQYDSRLKECDDELVSFISQTLDWQFNNELAQFPVKHGIEYLDALCSVKFDTLGRNDKKKIIEVMEMVLKKTIGEAKQGLESEDK
ncbi:hypothetical protein [Caproiciproducens sp. CPB-2]|uniref:hypothetical protein n=1 Tax=Caproiciproducens sp. CPB-2 TaxID=3030017 RepID=UPI0023DACD33|nr:hypothetical protein [Caproiciproducens sp. CPB-2]MDF1496316.1 hypothetical protein [Caproiciproducens sp. CPB-2]